MKAIIVEDNPSAVNLLKSFLLEYPLPIDVCFVTANVDEASKAIQKHRPELWFLDIQLSDQLVFSLFNELDSEIVKSSSIIFITAYFNAEYIHQALKTAAVDYIQKPFDKDQLFKAIDNAIAKSNSNDLLSRIANLEHLVNNMSNKDNKLPLFRANGKIDYVALDDVIYFNSEDTITRFHLKSSEIIPSSKSLKYYTDYVEDLKQFFKISKQTVINLNHLLTFDKKTSTVHLDGPTTLEVSRRCSSELADRFKIKSEKS